MVFQPKFSMKHAEAINALGENQFRLRHNYTTNNVPLIDEFVTEVYRLTFTNILNLQNDAKACFDRIIKSHAMLSSRKFKVLDKIYNIHSTTLHNTEYRVQTALGSSQNHYKNSLSSSLHGNDQDSGSSGTNWVYISVPIMSTLEKQNKGYTIISPDKKISWKT